MLILSLSFKRSDSSTQRHVPGLYLHIPFCNKLAIPFHFSTTQSTKSAMLDNAPKGGIEKWLRKEQISLFTIYFGGYSFSVDRWWIERNIWNDTPQFFLLILMRRLHWEANRMISQQHDSMKLKVPGKSPQYRNTKLFGWRPEIPEQSAQCDAGLWCGQTRAGSRIR